MAPFILSQVMQLPVA
ncbi:unnamed protein product [Linum tenue]|uniref:Uncharacterized protein n=1 Tax=Linum tenue TaxID=586396 RepID=A0AAV0IP48_9ROSI|nr:unnamed protein product [Linum tenue]